MNDSELLQTRASEAATLLKAMSNPNRLLILCMLCDAPGTSAGDLAKITGLSPSATSQHLARMREEGLIDSQRDAQRIHYFIKNDAVKQIVATLKTLYCP
ncbi:metalloregulator ArsR/SmtB family transcription factor [Kluyvera intermedia]|uniref:ArsR/SmtB family transcription factor n=1 Tax=Kluyvera TaxID=579 RepID=UPI001F36165B|nr:metalloregulator ArsR/SmtB family transcription factor [Kluyvera intermedia]MCE9888280.1 metalloregulator ArsR/SmtB family transcription factor [Kluyvera intermedia]